MAATTQLRHNTRVFMFFGLEIDIGIRRAGSFTHPGNTHQPLPVYPDEECEASETGLPEQARFARW